jgi:DNA modification methylase
MPRRELNPRGRGQRRMTKNEVNRDNFRDELRGKGRRRRKSAGTLSIGTSSLARNDILPKLTVENLAVGVLNHYSRRLRKSDQAHIREIANSISEFGFNVPILVGENNTVVDGETRLEAARLLGLSNTPCIRVDHLDKREQRLLRLAVNRLGEKGTWDLDELEAEFEELLIEDAPIEITGFGPGEVDQVLIGDQAAGIETGDLEPRTSAKAVAQIGDVFRLGPHRLICGNATDPAVIRELMRDDVARMIFADAPFDARDGGLVTGGSDREFLTASGETGESEFLVFNRRWMSAALPHLVDGGILAAFIGWRGFPAVHASAMAEGLTPLDLIVWAKTTARRPSLYRSQHELLPLFKKGNAAHVNNIAPGKRGRRRSNLWSYPSASSIGSSARNGLQEHPTVKPSEMLSDALLDLSDRGEEILDLFAGSGSTLIACDKVGRVCRCVELDPLYVDVIIRRYALVSANQVFLEATSESFEQLTQRRRGEARPGL